MYMLSVGRKAVYTSRRVYIPAYTLTEANDLYSSDFFQNFCNNFNAVYL